MSTTHLVIVARVHVPCHSEVGYLDDESGVDETISGGQVAVHEVFRSEVFHAVRNLSGNVHEVVLQLQTRRPSYCIARRSGTTDLHLGVSIVRHDLSVRRIDLQEIQQFSCVGSGSSVVRWKSFFFNVKAGDLYSGFHSAEKPL